MYIPDNYDAFCQYDAEQQAALKRLPVCCECGEHIQDEYCYEVNDEFICEQCMEDNHRRAVDDCI